jgi:hypothetical protein
VLDNLRTAYRTLRTHAQNHLELYGLLGFALVFRLVFMFGFTKPFEYLASDMGSYNWQAIDVAYGRVMGIPPYQSGMYNFAVGMVFKLANTFSLQDYQLFWVISLNCLLLVFSTWCLYWIAHKYFGRGLALVSTLLTAFWYPLIHINVFLLTENFFIPCFMGGLYLWLTQPRTRFNLFLTALLWSLAAGFRTYFLLFLGVWVLWIIIKPKFRWGAKLSVITTTGLTMLAMIGIVSSISGGETKFLSAGGGVNFAITWCDISYIKFETSKRGYGFIPPVFSADPNRKVVEETVDFTDTEHYYQMGWRCLQDNPGMLVKQLRSIPNMFYSVFFPQAGSIVGEPIFRLLFRDLTIFMSLLSLPGLVLAIRKNGQHWWSLISFLTLCLAVYAQNPGEERYLIPIMPLIIMYGVYGADLIAKAVWEKLNLVQRQPEN